MKFLDWAIVGAYLVYVVWDGVRKTKGSDKIEGYFLANRGLPWWAVGLSVMATQMSAITLVGTTGQAYSDGMRFIQFYYGLPLAMIILCITIVPFFYRAKVFTAYEYLEKRFDAKTRSLTSFFFLLSRGMSVGVVIAAPSVILSIVLGWDQVTTIFAIGLTTTVYTMVGGVQAVTWTDVKQMVIIMVGLSVCLIIILSSFPSGVTLTDGLHLAGTTGKLTTIDTSFNLNERYTIWSGLIGGMFLALAYFGTDQSQVQRFLTAKSVSQSRTSLLMSAFLKIPLQFMILLIGVLVFVFYQFQPPPMIFNSVEAAKARAARPVEYQALEEKYNFIHAEREKAALDFVSAKNNADPQLIESAKQSYLDANQKFSTVRREATEFIKAANNNSSFNDVNYVFPNFVIENMPMGVIGLIIAAIFAAAMSSVSSELNALATATVIDFYRRHFKTAAADEHYIRAGRIATAFWGVFACVVAIYATNLGSLIEVVNRFGSYFYGSLLGVFVLAIGVKRARARGAFFGLLFGIASVAIINNFAWVANQWQVLTGRSDLSVLAKYLVIEFLWFNVIGCVITVVAGYLISLTVREDNNAATES